MPKAIPFEEQYIPEPNSGCWLWLGAIHPNGYGKTKQQYAHRFSWQMFRGPIGDGNLVLHKCDVPGCVNPDHLFLGSHADNTRDMFRKGRSYFKRGRPHPHRPGRKLEDGKLRCTCCGEMQPIDAFYRTATLPHGRAYFCIPCHKKRRKLRSADDTA